MIGRTNILFGSGGGSGGSGGVTTVDLPTCPASLTANSGNHKVTLTLAYSDTDFVSGVEVRYKMGSYPTSPTDGAGKTVTSAAISIEVTGLTNGTTYYFRVYLYREIDGVKYYQTDETNAKIEGVPTGNVSVSGITPAKVGDDYLIIDTSGTFTLTVPEGRSATVYLVGGGCYGGRKTAAIQSAGGENGGYGGYVYSFPLSAVDSASCTCSVGSVSFTYNAPSNTSLNISGTTYNASSGTCKSGGVGSDGSSNAGSGTTGQYVRGQYLGSSGGGGGYYDDKRGQYYGANGGAGAGSGGYLSSTGSYNGTSASHYGCGGGGGALASIYGDTSSSGSGGAGKKGCIIIAWI